MLSVAWLGLIQTDSILIREKRKHLSKTSDRVTEKVLESRLERLRVEKSFHRSIY